MRYAQIIDGRVTNPCDGLSRDEALKSSFAHEFWAGHEATWVQVPDKAPANAKLDGKGGWEAVAAPAPAAAPADPVCARLDAMQVSINKIAEKLGVDLGDVA